MNKLFIPTLLGFFLLFLCSCKNNKETIVINYFDTDLPVIVKKAKDINSIIGIGFSKKIKVENKSFLRKSFVELEYRYNMNRERCHGIALFKQKKGKLTRISNNKKRNIPVIGNLEYVFYTRHFVDSTKHLQKQLKPYLEKMLQQGKDTLHIGTVAEFKQTHKELFEMLTKNDSISIYLLDDKTKSGLGERIAVPVEW